jgi:hypothetical protein
MKIEINKINGTVLAEVYDEGVIIHKTQDALDLMAECNYLGANKIILHEMNLLPAFFDLKTGIAGEILQKFSTYDNRLAIIGNFTRYNSKSLNDFIFESNKYKRINFVSTLEEAREKLI